MIHNTIQHFSRIEFNIFLLWDPLSFDVGTYVIRSYKILLGSQTQHFYGNFWDFLWEIIIFCRNLWYLLLESMELHRIQLWNFLTWVPSTLTVI